MKKSCQTCSRMRLLTSNPNWTCEKCKQLRIDKKQKQQAEEPKQRHTLKRIIDEERRATRVVREYGISKDEYVKLLREQGGVCAICFQLPKENHNLHVDHDHETELIRGLLCGNCNKAIGLMKESSEIFESAILYINKHKKGGSK